MNKREAEVFKHGYKAENKALKDLYDTYIEALGEVDQKLAELVASDLQSKIYQARYQELIKKQLEAALKGLDEKQYTTIDEYVNACYKDGYIGSMYSLHGQGVPMVFAVDQDLATKAIRINSPISEGLYKHLGENTKNLKESIRREITRGISMGVGYSDMVVRIKRKMCGKYTNPQGAFAYASRIVRTEGHRVQEQASMDAAFKAKRAGADIVKQWDSTMDKRTRTSHMELDGQIRELEKPFEYRGYEAMVPGMFGVPSEDINCRCAALKRSRSALDEEELETLRERAEYFGLDKAKNFEEFKAKYLEWEEHEQSHKGIKRSTIANTKVIESSVYREKFAEMTPDDAINKTLFEQSKVAIRHRSGSDFEDLVFVNSKGEFLVSNCYEVRKTAKPTKRMMKELRKENDYSIIALHNHPDSMPPSLNDIMTATTRKYDFGVVACHDGTIYKYRVLGEIDEVKVRIALAKLEENKYNEVAIEILLESNIEMQVM